MAAAAVIPLLSGCGAEDRTNVRETAGTQDSSKAPQVILGLPQLGALLARCDDVTDDAPRIDLRYRAGPHGSEIVSVRVGSERVQRRTLDPRGEIEFTAPVTRTSIRDGGQDQTSTIRLTVRAPTEPFEISASVRLVLALAEDGTGECVARRARAKVSTDFH